MNPSMSSIAGHSFQPRKLKLGVNDHLMGADVSDYSDIRIISAFEIFGYFARIFQRQSERSGPRVSNSPSSAASYV